MWRKRIFKWQPSKLLWIWIFGAVTKVRTTEKNSITSVACYEVAWSHQLVLLNKKRSYTDASIAVVNGCITCICSWLVVIYILHVRETSSSYLSASNSASGFAIIKKQHLSFFVAGQGTLVSCIFMCFSINFQTSSCGCFVCFCLFSFVEIAFLVF